MSTQKLIVESLQISWSKKKATEAAPPIDISYDMKSISCCNGNGGGSDICNQSNNSKGSNNSKRKILKQEELLCSRRRRRKKRRHGNLAEKCKNTSEDGEMAEEDKRDNEDENETRTDNDGYGEPEYDDNSDKMQEIEEENDAYDDSGENVSDMERAEKEDARIAEIEYQKTHHSCRNKLVVTVVEKARTGIKQDPLKCYERTRKRKQLNEKQVKQMRGEEKEKHMHSDNDSEVKCYEVNYLESEECVNQVNEKDSDVDTDEDEGEEKVAKSNLYDFVADKKKTIIFKTTGKENYKANHGDIEKCNSNIDGNHRNEHVNNIVVQETVAKADVQIMAISEPQKVTDKKTDNIDEYEGFQSNKIISMPGITTVTTSRRSKLLNIRNNEEQQHANIEVQDLNKITSAAIVDFYSHDTNTEKNCSSNSTSRYGKQKEATHTHQPQQQYYANEKLLPAILGGNDIAENRSGHTNDVGILLRDQNDGKKCGNIDISTTSTTTLMTTSSNNATCSTDGCATDTTPFNNIIHIMRDELTINSAVARRMKTADVDNNFGFAGGSKPHRQHNKANYYLASTLKSTSTTLSDDRHSNDAVTAGAYKSQHQDLKKHFTLQEEPQQQQHGNIATTIAKTSFEKQQHNMHQQHNFQHQQLQKHAFAHIEMQQREQAQRCQQQQQHTGAYEHMMQQFPQYDQQLQNALPNQHYTQECINQLQHEERQMSLQHQQQQQQQLFDSQLLQQQHHQQQQQNEQEQQYHLMAYLQHQYQQQMQEAYQQQQYQQHQRLLMTSQHQQTANATKHANALPVKTSATTIDALMIDELHEDPSSTVFKLSLSPAAVKHENQDDGYETSAGDVLTPNSHSSSTHSVTPHHQIQHSTVCLIPPAKATIGNAALTICERQLQQPHLQLQYPPLHLHGILGMTKVQNSNPTLAPDPHSFIDDQLGAPAAVTNINVNDNSGVMLGAPNHESSPLSTTPVIDSASAPRSMDGHANLNILDITTATVRQQQDEHHMLPLQQQPAVLQQEQPQKEDESHLLQRQQIYRTHTSNNNSNSQLLTQPPLKRRGRKKKNIVLATTEFSSVVATGIECISGNPQDVQNQTAVNAASDSANLNVAIATKERKKHDRFNGMSEEEVAKRTLPDHLCDNLDVVIIGINPGLFAAYKGHHYAGPGNHFWKCLYLSGLTQEEMSADEDHKLMKYGIGFTNMVQRATKGSADLTRKEIKEGSRILLEKLQRFRPKIAVFNGKLIFEVFSGKKDFNFGRQSEYVDGTNTYIWVMPSSSARCAQLPRAADKVPFYASLNKFRNFLNGLIPHMDEAEYVFTEQRIKQVCREQQENVNSLPPLTEQPLGLLYGSTASSNSDILSPNQKSNTGHSMLQQRQPLPQQRFGQDSSYLYSSDNDDGTGPEVSIASSAAGTFITTNQPRSGPTSSVVLMTHQQTQQLQSCGNYNMLDNYHVQQLQQPLLQKKKRGRPKKIKGQEIIDPATNQKIQSNNNNSHDFNSNILNLSLISDGNVTNLKVGEVPKKKRGRPKKLKLSADIIQQRHEHLMVLMHQQPHHSKPSAIESPTRQLHQQSVIYGTPPPHVKQQHRMYGTVSPIRSPALNCTYSAAVMTPPNSGGSSSSQAPQHQQCDLDTMAISHNTGSNNYYGIGDDKTSNEASTVTMSCATGEPPHLSESPALTSPNICAVDFEAPVGVTTSSEQQKSELQQLSIHQCMQQQQCYASPVHEAAGWLSPPQQQHHFNHQLQQRHHQQQLQVQQRTTAALRYPQQPQMQYLGEMHHNQQPQHQSWQHQKQQYGDRIVNHHNYIISPSTSHHQESQQQQQHLLHSHQHTVHCNTTVGIDHHHNSHQSQFASDITSKSLSGLESLVHRIPAISESETISSISVAAAVGSRLQGSQQQQMQPHQQQQICQRGLICATEFSPGHFGSAATSANGGGTSCGSSNIVTETGESLLIGTGDKTSGNNTPHTVANMYGIGSDAGERNSPGDNYNIKRINSTLASTVLVPVSISPPHLQQNQQQYSTSLMMADMLPPITPATLHNHDSHNSPSSPSATPAANVATGVEIGDTPVATLLAASIVTAASPHHSIFSVSNLAASAATPTNSSNNENRLPSYAIEAGTSNGGYHHRHHHHHSNLMAAAALAAVAVNSSVVPAAAHVHNHVAHTQMYLDQHIPSHHHVPVNSIYAPSALPHHTHHRHEAVVAYGTTQHVTAGVSSSNYGGTSGSTSYGTMSASALNLHNPNYPYGYGAPRPHPAQSSHAGMHATCITPPPTNVAVTQHTPPGAISAADEAATSAAAVADYHHNQHPHDHAMHARNPLNIFERLRPNDSGGYSGF